MKEEIKVQLFRFLNKELGGEEFQQWTYLFCDELEKEFSLDDYLDIMCFDYNRKGGYYLFTKILFKYISKEEFENYRVKILFTKALEDDDIMEEALAETYDLASSGNEIFDIAGYSYGINLIDRSCIGEEEWCVYKSSKEFIEKTERK